VEIVPKTLSYNCSKTFFFCERVIAPWNYLSVNNESLGSISLLLHSNVLLKDPIYHHLYITYRPSTGIRPMLCYCTNVCNEGICQRNSLMSYSCICFYVYVPYLYFIVIFTTVNS